MPQSSPAWVLTFAQIDAHDLPHVGGKGLNLGLLARGGLPVPPGFCVTTAAFWAIQAADPDWPTWRERLDAVAKADLAAARQLGGALRDHIRARPIPPSITEAVVGAWSALDRLAPYAVRSSATAEDLPTASFAGQQDTYLNVIGQTALLDRLRACWASLYTDRAILYRLQNDIPHAQVGISVVVQRMIAPDKSGILFTADPHTQHRGITTIDAGFGLGEALVSGLINPDLIRIETASERILSVEIGHKALAIRPVAGGGTRQEPLSAEQAQRRVLSDPEALALCRLGARIATLQGGPQDIEWCIQGDQTYIVQARPITSLFPLPSPAPTDSAEHVYFCVNHFQVMLDPFPPLAREHFMRFLALGRGLQEVRIGDWLAEAGGRIYVDLAEIARLKPARKLLLKALGGVDELAQAKLRVVAERPEFQAGPKLSGWALARFAAPRVLAVLRALLFSNPTRLRARLEARLKAVTQRACAAIQSDQPLPERLHACRSEGARFFSKLLFLPIGVGAAILARKLLGAALTPAAADDLAAIERGLAGNITTAMDLAVGDLATVARALPNVSAALQTGEVDRARLRALPGGDTFDAALGAFLDQYGFRGASEIDLSRPRWAEDPTAILRAISGALSHPDADHRARYEALCERGDQAAAALPRHAKPGLLAPLRRLWIRRLARVYRALMPLREHPKFAMVQVFDAIRHTVLEAAERLVQSGTLNHRDAVWFLKLDEVEAALKDDPGGPRDPDLNSSGLQDRIQARQTLLERYRHHWPPRVLTQNGECPVVTVDRGDAPDGALCGTGVSPGVYEGIVRVIRDPNTEVLHHGEVLVAPFTDPGWTPLFINAKALVMEVGGMMTHGSVVAREYGIPAVVGVPQATTALKTGQRVRVDGERGWVEVLP